MTRTRHSIRMTHYTADGAPVDGGPRCATCGLPVNWTAFARRDGSVVSFVRHWPVRKQ